MACKLILHPGSNLFFGYIVHVCFCMIITLYSLLPVNPCPAELFHIIFSAFKAGIANAISSFEWYFFKGDFSLKGGGDFLGGIFHSKGGLSPLEIFLSGEYYEISHLKNQQVKCN